MNNGNCPKCKSPNIELVPTIDDEDGMVIPDLSEGHCNDCGSNFLMVDL